MKIVILDDHPLIINFLKSEIQQILPEVQIISFTDVSPTIHYIKKSIVDFVICDFVAPLPEMRHNFKADWTIWIDTIDQGRYDDTNKAFVPPDVYDFRITEQNAEKWAEFVGQHILDNRRRPTFD